MVVISLATLGVSTLPSRLATYRELGVLRRLSTTPVDPAALLIAQLVDQHGRGRRRAGRCSSSSATVAFEIPLPGTSLGVRGRVPAGDVVAVRARPVDRGRRPHGRAPTRSVLPVLLRGHVPRRRLPAALAAAGGPDPSATSRRRASRPCRTPGSGASPSPAARGHGRDHRGRRRSGRPLFRWE